MATISHDLRPSSHDVLNTGFPQPLRNKGTNGPVEWLAFDATTPESAFWELEAVSYGSGNVTVDVVWGAAAATSGTVRWQAQLAAITPESDTTDPETKSFATAVAVDDTHLGTTAHRLMRATIALSGASLDSLAAADQAWLRITRVADHANDNLAGDAWLKAVRVSYSDT